MDVEDVGYVIIRLLVGDAQGRLDDRADTVWSMTPASTIPFLHTLPVAVSPSIPTSTLHFLHTGFLEGDSGFEEVRHQIALRTCRRGMVAVERITTGGICGQLGSGCQHSRERACRCIRIATTRIPNTGPGYVHPTYCHKLTHLPRPTGRRPAHWRPMHRSEWCCDRLESVSLSPMSRSCAHPSDTHTPLARRRILDSIRTGWRHTHRNTLMVESHNSNRTCMSTTCISCNSCTACPRLHIPSIDPGR